jgi:2-iminobutanoate/2-iminopropanoate deaminase
MPFERGPAFLRSDRPNSIMSAKHNRAELPVNPDRCYTFTPTGIHPVDGSKDMRAIGLTVSLALMLLATSQLEARDYLKSERAQSRGFSPGVVTEGGKIVWVSGQTGLVDEQGKSMAGNFEGQARVIFRAIDAVVRRAGGSLKDVVTITVYLTDPRLIDPLMPIRREFFPDENFPASTTITVHSLPAVGMMLEISAVAVIGDK